MRSARNIYRDDVDFAALALQFPDFAKWYVHCNLQGRLTRQSQTKRPIGLQRPQFSPVRGPQ